MLFMQTKNMNQTAVLSNVDKRMQLTFLKSTQPVQWGQRLRLLSAALVGAGVLGLAGCSLQPVYQTPKLEVPAQFKEATPQAAKFGVWVPAQNVEVGRMAGSPIPKIEGGNVAAVPEQWWTIYNDAALNQLQADAARGNPSVEQAVARLRAAQAAVATSRAAQLPTLSTTGSGTRALTGGGTYSNTNGDNVARSGSINNNFSLGLSASWELDLWGKLSGAVDANKATAQATVDDLAAARLSAQASVAQTYFSLRAAEAQMLFLQESLDNYQQSLKLTENRYKSGVASSADVAQAQSQYKSTQASLIEAQTTRAQLEHALAALLGKAPAAFSLSVTGQLPTPPVVPEMLASTLLEQRPDIAAAERRVSAANAQIGVARAAFFPSLTLSASGGYRNALLSDLFNAPNLFWSLGPALAMSLFDGGARSAAVESARASLDLASATYKQTVITALQEVEDNLVAASNLALEQQVQADALSAAQKSLTVANNQYKAGIVAYLNVLSAQSTALSAQNNLISVKSRRLTAVNTLLKNVAGRWQAPEQGTAKSVEPSVDPVAAKIAP